MNRKIAAAVAAAALTLGGLALATPALADDTPVPTPTSQEVAPSPESTPPDSSTPTDPSVSPDSSTPTDPSASTTTDATSSSAPADTSTKPEDAAPATSPATDESNAESSQPTGPSPAPSVSSPTPLVASTPTVSASLSSPQPAPEAAGDEWFTWLMPVTSLPADQQGHVGAQADWFPQQPLGLGQIAPEPGTCVQQDHYKGPRHKLDALYSTPLTWNDGHASDNDIPGVHVLDWTIICQEPTPPVLEKDAAGAITVTAATCDEQGMATLDGVVNASLEGDLSQVPGPHTVTLVADEGHAFADGSTTLQIEYTIPDKTGDCPVITPVPTPVVIQTPPPAAVVVTVPTPTPVAQEIVDTDQGALAHTGSDAEGALTAAIICIMGVIAGATVLTVQAIRRRRAEAE